MLIDKEKFDKNLLLTQVYCDKVLKSGFQNPAIALRTFNPLYNGKQMFQFVEHDQFTGVEWAKDPWHDSDTLYNDLYLQQLEHKENAKEKQEESGFFQGRILIAEIDDTVVDGASEANSDGFIDVYDCPPIDTWFYMAQDDGFRVLFAWVPDQFVELANVAIAVNCIDCLNWYTDENLRQREESFRSFQMLRKKQAALGARNNAPTGIIVWLKNLLK